MFGDRGRAGSAPFNLLADPRVLNGGDTHTEELRGNDVALKSISTVTENRNGIWERMPKGRYCNPSTRNDGQWFYHPNSQESQFCRMPESTRNNCNTRPIQNLSPSKLNDKLPSLYDAHEKGLGREKRNITKQTEHTIELWDHGNPREMSGRFGFTTYQTSYQGNQETERPFCRRFPKIPSKNSQNAHAQNPTDILWFGKNRKIVGSQSFTGLNTCSGPRDDNARILEDIFKKVVN
ncbi:hypothetical protein scyTo_0005996 [Scyliorhinus torazame]|uniref:Uncharacterized protein n=1 Tax=Scyliorhinus torazame TaxID=75743 RepID=A0A401PEJ5_SCYTO|nr:hypothetical protein [Scyliorhinus torazame]